MSLNRRQELFVAEYLIDRNATKAAARAGYSERRAQQTGWELLQKPHVAAAIAKASKARQEELGIDADWITARYVAAHEKAMAEGQIAAGVRALDSLAKLLGIGAADKHEITVAGTGEVVYTLALDRQLGEEQED